MKTGSHLSKAVAAILFGIVCSTLTCGNSANAQSFLGGKAAKRPAMESDALKDKTPIKDLPEYTGKQKFISGKTMKTSLGPQYQHQFIAMEEPAQVVSWYKSALSSYKWEVTTSEDNAVSGKKPDGAYVSIIVNPYHRPDGRSMVTVNYNEYKIDSVGDASE